MKKLGLLVMPLMAISLLTNCGPVKYQVVFDSNGGTSVPIQKVEEKKCATKPDNPTKASTTDTIFTFSEWQLDGETYDFNTPVTKDIILKAKWTSSTRYYTVTFDSDGGSDIAPQADIEYEGIAFDPGAPARKDTDEWKYTFNGWHKLKEDGSMEEDEFDFDNTPIIEDITLKADWLKEKRKYTIKFFDEDGTTELDIMENVPYGEIIEYQGVIPTKEPTATIRYTFSGWNPTLNPGDTVTGNQTYVATYAPSERMYVVSFDSDGGTDVETKEVPYHRPIYSPDTPTKEDDYAVYDFKGWYKVKEDGTTEDNPTTFPFNIEEDMVLRAKWEIGSGRKEYNFRLLAEETPEDDFHLTYRKMSGEEIHSFTYFKIPAGQDFQFIIEADNESSQNDFIYYVPTNLNIYIDSEVPLAPGYGYYIDFDDDSHTRATVTIKGEIISSDVEVSGNEAGEMNYYSLDFYYFAVDVDPIAKHWRIDQDGVITLKKKDDYPLPNKSYIRFKIDNRDWMFADDPGAEQYVEYVMGEEEGTLTIKANAVQSAICISVRAGLNDLSWKEIDDLATSGWAEKMFLIGETKDIYLFNQKHKVRIIDINHDKLSDGSGMAGITFEFENLITKADGTLLTSVYDDDCLWEYKNSLMYKTLNNTVYNEFPSELKEVIKMVKKTVGMAIYDKKEYPSVKLFSLAYSELTGCYDDNKPDATPYNEGSQYAYYKGKTNYKKTAVGSKTAAEYWTRSNCYGDDNLAFCVPTSGVLSERTTKEFWIYKLGVNCAFCV